MTPEMIVLALMCYLGVIAAAALPYYRKKEIKEWDSKYTWVVLVACGMAVVTLESTILQYAETATWGNGLLTPLFSAFATGFGFVTGTSELMKIIEQLKARWIPVQE